MTDTDNLPVQPSHGALAEESLRLRREDLAALTAAYLRDNRRPRQWAGVAVGIGGLALGALLIALTENFGWPAALEPYFFFGGWAIMLGCWGVVWRRERALLKQYQVTCPACEASLLAGGRDGLARVELVIATGNCPRCGAQVLAP